MPKGRRDRAALLTTAAMPEPIGTAGIGHNQPPSPLDILLEPAIREEAALAITGLSRAGFWKAISCGRLPEPYHPLPAVAAWRASEIRAAMERTRKTREERAAQRAARKTVATAEVETTT